MTMPETRVDRLERGYRVWIGSNTTIDLSTMPGWPTLPRIDTIAVYRDSQGRMIVGVLHGRPAVAPVPPWLPPDHGKIADFLVHAGCGDIRTVSRIDA